MPFTASIHVLCSRQGFLTWKTRSRCCSLVGAGACPALSTAAPSWEPILPKTPSQVLSLDEEESLIAEMLSVLKPSCVTKKCYSFFEDPFRKVDELKCFSDHRRNWISISCLRLTKGTAVLAGEANACLLVMDVYEWEVKVPFILNSQVPQSEFQSLNQSMPAGVTVPKQHNELCTSHYSHYCSCCWTGSAPQFLLAGVGGNTLCWKDLLGSETSRCLLSSQLASVGRWVGRESFCRGGTVNKAERQSINYTKGRKENRVGWNTALRVNVWGWCCSCLCYWNYWRRPGWGWMAQLQHHCCSNPAGVSWAWLGVSFSKADQLVTFSFIAVSNRRTGV